MFYFYFNLRLDYLFINFINCFSVLGLSEGKWFDSVFFFLDFWMKGDINLNWYLKRKIDFLVLFLIFKKMKYEVFENILRRRFGIFVFSF